MTHLSRRSLLAAAGLVTAGTLMEGCGAAGRIITVATPYLKRFAEQFVLNKLEDGVTWLGERGIDLAGKQIFSDGPGYLRALGLTGDVWEDGSRVLFAVDSGELDDKPAAGMITAAGEQLLLLPRAGQALSKTFDALQKGSAEIGAMSADRAADYLYPTAAIDVAPEIDQSGRYENIRLIQTFRYQAREGTVFVFYVEPSDTSIKPYEYISIESFEGGWTYDVGPRRTELA